MNVSVLIGDTFTCLSSIRHSTDGWVDPLGDTIFCHLGLLWLSKYNPHISSENLNVT